MKHLQGMILLFLTLLPFSVPAQMHPVPVVESGEEIYAGADEVFFSPDNRFMALATDQQIRVYDLATGFLLKKIVGENNYSFLHFAPDFSSFDFCRLKNLSEPNDSLSFESVRETFTGKELIRMPHQTQDYTHYFRPLGSLVLQHDEKGLHLRKLFPADSTIDTHSSYWSTSEDGRLLILSKGNSDQQYCILRLPGLDTLYQADLGQTPRGGLNAAEQSWYKDRGDYLFTPRVYMPAGNRYLVQTASLAGEAYRIRIWDTQSSSVVFSRLFPELPDAANPVFGAVHFSPASGLVTLPATGGIEAFFIDRPDSFFIPVLKKALKADVYLDGEGRSIIINTQDSIYVTDAGSRKKILALPLASHKVLVNNGYPYLYFTTDELNLQKETWIYDTHTHTLVDSPGVMIKKISPDGKWIYGSLEFRNYIFDNRLRPIRAVNNCTPYTLAIHPGQDPDLVILTRDDLCEFRNTGTVNTTDFSAWNLRRLQPIRNDAPASDLKFERLNGFEFSASNLYYLEAGSLFSSFRDTLGPKEISDRYGSIKALKGNYAVFLKSPGMANLVEDSSHTVTDSLFVLYGLTRPTCMIALPQNLFPFAAGIDTLSRKLAILCNGNSQNHYQCLLYNLSGKLITTRPFFIAPGTGFDYADLQIAGIAPDNSWIHVSAKVDLNTGTTRHLLIDLNKGRAMFDQNGFLAADPASARFIAVDNSQFLVSGSLTGTRRILRQYPVVVTDSLVLAVNPAGSYTDYNPASLLFPQYGRYRVSLTDWRTGDTLFRTSVENDFVTVGAVSASGRRIALARNDHRIEVLDTRPVPPVFLPGHEGYIYSLAFSRDEKLLLSSSNDGTCKIWSMDSLREIARFIPLGGEDYVFFSPDGYYTCSRGAASKLGFVYQSSVFAPYQLDMYYNRPDILLERMGCPDLSLIQAYHEAWRKRLARSGFNPDQLQQIFRAPILSILNQDSISLTTPDTLLRIHLRATDPTLPLYRLNAWVNESPLFGASGLQLSPVQGKLLDTVLTIHLSDSLNRIEAAVTNTAGVESYRQAFYITCTAPRQASATWLVGIASNDFADPALHLDYAEKDISDLDSMFALHCKMTHTPYHSILLTGNDVTRARIEGLRKSLLQSRISDRVILAFSGHGVLDDSLDFYLGTRDMDFSHPDLKGLPYQALEGLLDSIPARNRLLLLDACHSGETDKTTNEGSLPFTEKLRQLKTGAAQKKLGLQNSFELMKELFSDVSVSAGITVISAARGNQFANEGSEWNNGAFTWCLLNGLGKGLADANGDGTITVHELRDYISREVEQLTHGQQQPTTRKELLFNDWPAW